MSQSWQADKIWYELGCAASIVFTQLLFASPSDTFPFTVQVSWSHWLLSSLSAAWKIFSTRHATILTKAPKWTVFSLCCFLLSTPVLPLYDVQFYSAYLCQLLSYHILSFLGEGEEVHAPSGQLKTQRRGEGFHVQQIRLCYLQHRVKVCVCDWRPVFVYVRFWQVSTWVRIGSSVLVTCLLKL